MIKILTVDDNKDNRMAIRLILEDYGELSIFEADNGKKAVETVRATKPDIVLMDIMMPIMDGIEATREIRKFDKNVMIIALSVLSDDEHKNKILEAGADDYITKPINEGLFRARIKNYVSILEYRREREIMSGAVNLFSDDIYPKKTSFTIEDEANLAEFWDYEMPAGKNDNLCDTIRAIYNTGLYLLKTNSSFYIITEENDETLFFSIIGANNFIAQDIRSIFAKESSIATLAIKNNEISVSIPKIMTLPQVVQKEKMIIDDDSAKILRMNHTEKISAKNFAAELEPDIVDKLEKLEANEELLDALVYEFETKHELETLKKIGGEMWVYSTEIDSLYEFKNLSYALSGLSNFLQQIKDEEVDERKKEKLGLILRSILADLANWRKTVFIDQSTEDIHYLDSSLLSSCLQAELIFKNATIDDDDLELF